MAGKDSKRSISLCAKSPLDLGPLEHLRLRPMQLRTRCTKKPFELPSSSEGGGIRRRRL